MNTICEMVALFFGFVSVILVGISLQNPYWRKSSDAENVILTSNFFENLWTSCATDSAGINCRDYPSLLAVPGRVQASRALIIASIAFGTFGILVTLVGMRCSKAIGENHVLKGRIAGFGGVLFLLQGLCTMIAVSWYAFTITQEFFDPFFPGTKYEIGEALYIGWASATLAIIGGVILLCSCKSGKSHNVPYPYQAARTTASSMKLDSGDAGSQKAPSHYDRNAYV